MRRFYLSGLPYEPFAKLFELSDDELAGLDVRRVVADADFGFPCRVSLADAVKGEELLLLPYVHQPASSPYRASGPIYVRRGAEQLTLPPGVVPPCVTRRLISLRAYDQQDLMVDGQVVEGDQVAAALGSLFDRRGVAYVHLHNAKRGCFSCVAERKCDAVTARP